MGHMSRGERIAARWSFIAMLAMFTVSVFQEASYLDKVVENDKAMIAYNFSTLKLLRDYRELSFKIYSKEERNGCLSMHFNCILDI